MAKFVLNCLTGASEFNAGGKAPSDVLSVLERDGWMVLTNRYMTLPRFWRLPLILLTPIARFFRIPRGSTLLFQHPYDTAHDAISMMNRIMLFLLRCRKVTTVALVHDLESLRFGGSLSSGETALLGRYDCVIVHSEAMKRQLLDAGLNSRISVLGLFDYLVDRGGTSDRASSDGLCFAGNLDKSTFLAGIPEIPGMTVHLYGSKPSALPERQGFVWEGRFAAADLSDIKGGWGLVWDGEDACSCKGVLGEYLRYNSPHKASMYICAGLPLIVPEWSAIADEVRMKGLGLTVSSLDDVADAISSVTTEMYARMLDSVSAYASELTGGHHLEASLESAGVNQ